MEQVTKQDISNVMQKEDLEKKIGFWDRAKYWAGPATVTIGAYFGPELKKKYDNLSSEKKDTYRTVTLASTTLLGTVVAIASGYNLFKDYKEKKENTKNSESVETNTLIVAETV